MSNDLERIMEFIDQVTGPDCMSKERALELLEQVETELQGRMEALREEMADE